MADGCSMYPCMYIYEEAWGEILGTQWDEVASSGTSACMYSKACIIQVILTRVAKNTNHYFFGDNCIHLFRYFYYSRF